MSQARTQKRKRARIVSKHFDYLSQLLMGFYAFLEQEEKPSDEQVRDEFVQRDKQWRKYCRAHKLTEQAALMFNNEVAVSWQERYAKEPQP